VHRIAGRHHELANQPRHVRIERAKLHELCVPTDEALQIIRELLRIIPSLNGNSGIISLEPPRGTRLQIGACASALPHGERMCAS
jgi:hypothetical protein